MFTLIVQLHTLCPIVECTGHVDFMCWVVPEASWAEVSGLDPMKNALVDPSFRRKLSCGFPIGTFVAAPPLVATPVCPTYHLNTKLPMLPPGPEVTFGNEEPESSLTELVSVNSEGTQ